MARSGRPRGLRPLPRSRAATPAGVPIAGRVTMDMVMVDAGDSPVAIGDVATLYGGTVTLDDQAARAGTVSYELLTAVSARVARRSYGSALCGPCSEGRPHPSLHNAGLGPVDGLGIGS